MSTVWLVAANDLRRRVRNRSAVILAVVGPLVMAVLFGALLGGTTDATFTIGIVDVHQSGLSEQITASTDPSGESQVRFVTLADDQAARRAIDEGGVDAALVVNATFASGTGTGAVAGGSTSADGDARATLTVLRRADKAVSAQVAESVALAITSRYDTVALAAGLVARQTGGPPPDSLVDAAQTASAAGPLWSLRDEPMGAREVSPAAYFGASMSILFLFFTVGAAARSTLVESRDGTLARVLATPARPGAVIAGKTLSVALLAFGGIMTVWAVTALVFRADWGSPLAVAVLAAATVCGVAGAATLVVSLARTERQADAATSAVTFAFALLGGNFTGPGQGPALLRSLSLLTPNGWALRGFTDLSADAAPLSSIARTVVVLLAIAIVCGSVGLARVHRTITP